ncbi:uncharacterized protein PAC_17517 [Phialocephala subalpina]|uniref:Amidoligase enzyme n=1 Tax=Phialocephala subalpina TaxID=576137 RepID=A0A1L7XRP2_9HELO|nr:uncharacterized protein PAC_17517 [Phialocephala subalpina]
MSSSFSVFSPLDDPGGQAKADASIPSFGIELEFLVDLLPDGTPDPDPNDSRTRTGIFPFPLEAQQHIAKNLNSEFEDCTYMTTKELVQPFWAFTPSGNIDSKAEEDAFGRSAYGEWAVKGDISVEDHEKGATPYQYIAIEVVSPSYLFGANSIADVQRVAEHLAKTYKTKLNNTCKIHIHISCQHADFSLRHLKNIMAILWTFEKRFYQLVSEDRSNNMAYTGALNTGSRLGEEVASAAEGLERILAAESVGDLAHMLTDPTWIRLGFNIRDLNTQCTKSFIRKTTLEIRIHEGTLDPEEISNWAILFNRLSKFADSVNTENLNLWLRQHINDAEEDYDVFQLLRALKMPLHANYYAGKTVGRLGEEEKDIPLYKAAIVDTQR